MPNREDENNERTRPYKVPVSRKKQSHITHSRNSKNSRNNRNSRNPKSTRTHSGRIGTRNQRTRTSTSANMRTSNYKNEIEPFEKIEYKNKDRERNRENKKRQNKNKNKHPKLKMAIKILIIIILLACVIGAGVVAGMFFGLFGDEFEISKEELTIGSANSVVVDTNGEVIANLSGDEKRKIITLADMADYLPKAYVAIEDERFYKHSGVDLKRTAGAIVKTLMGNSSYGGSTITQQLVKNITKDDETSGIAGIFRKVKEWTKAYQVERMISKNQILELYLNILFVGSNNIHGVELGAEYYFNKSAKDLDLAECAFMAGINHSPNGYDPFDSSKDNSEKIKKRTLTVLKKMKDLKYIENQEEYDAAVAKVENGLPFSKGELSSGTNYSYHTDAIIEQVIDQVMNEKDISRELAKNYVYGSGLTIYSTVDKNIQARLEEETAKTKYQVKGYEKDKTGKTLNDHTQAAMVVIDYKTGNVLGVSGGLGEKTGANLNRATQIKRQPGSSIKPIADIAPALQEKIITAATVYDDVLTDFNGYQPKNDGKDYDGLQNIRYIIAKSKNVPEVKIMRELTPGKSIDYLRNFGISSLYKTGEDAKKDDESLPLAIGGISDGISPLEMAAAYATIANDGEYITPTFYTKVVDSSGNTVLTPNQEKRRVISEQNAYITKSILQEPVKNGTATYCAISGMDVAAKTGTTDNSYDRWLCGFTPYYAAACWYGYDNQEEVKYSGTNPAGQIWDAVMTDIHKNLTNATFIKPDGIVEQTVCKTTGCLATTGCSSTYKEIFTSDNLPEKCQGHGSQTICSESNKIATAYCSQYCTVRTNYYGAVIPKEQLNLWKPVNGSSSSGKKKIEGVCTLHTKPKETEKTEKTENTVTNTTKNTTNTSKNTAANTTENTANTVENTTNTEDTSKNETAAQ